MSDLKNVKDLTQFIEESWYKTSGLVAAVLVALAFCLSILVKADAVWWLWLVIPASTITAISFIWYVTAKIPPKTPKDKVGFVVCISCSDNKELERIVEDFVTPLRQLIGSGHSGNSFHFINLPQHFVSQVTDKSSAIVMGQKCKAQFMIFGRARLRIVGGSEKHVIELDGIVSHQPIPNEQSNLLANEFGELLPRNIHVDTNNDVFSFRFTSEWTEVVARYVIGIASACSGDVEYAERLYKDAEIRLSGADDSFPVYRKLKERIPIRLAELYEHMATVAHLNWAEAHDDHYLDELRSWLDKIPPNQTDRVQTLTLSAIYTFLHDRNVNEAIRLLKKIKNVDDLIGHCNLAFLYAYKGDLRQAIRQYRRASQCGITNQNFYQIEDFISWFLEQEPAKYQLNYCLGFLNWQIKGDVRLALEYFNKFLSAQASANHSDFSEEKSLAEKWIREMSVSSENCR